LAQREEEERKELEQFYNTLGKNSGIRSSYSRLDTYKSCPRKYKYQYIEPHEEILGEPLLIGQSVHSALEVWVSEGGEDVGDLIDAFTTACEVQRKVGYISDEEEALAISMLYDYYQQLEKIDSSLVVGIEEPFELRLIGTRIIGFIDRVAYLDSNKDTLIITDYKSGRSSITQAQAKNNLQMAIYRMAAEQLWPANHYITELVYPRLHKTVKHEFTQEELDMHREDIATTSLNIKLDTKFRPTGSPVKCGYCSFKSYCAYGRVQARIWEGIKRKREAGKR
jgi:CRISPR/Cas system-associated exonuclease Cas4 (RecB family)